MIKDKDISSLYFKRKEKVTGVSCREETFWEGLAQLSWLLPVCCPPPHLNRTGLWVIKTPCLLSPYVQESFTLGNAILLARHKAPELCNHTVCP